MDTSTFEDLVLFWLESNKDQLRGSRISTTKNISTNGLKFTLIKFNYNGFDVELHIYNDTFIKVLIENTPGKICGSFSDVKKTLEQFNIHKYEY